MKQDAIIQMLRNLEADNIFSSKVFYKDISSLIDTDINKLYRYEYRRSNKNLKCIFVLEKEDKSKILLNAFSEDGSKKKGNDTYNFNIKRAVKIYCNIKEELQ